MKIKFATNMKTAVCMAALAGALSIGSVAGVYAAVPGQNMMQQMNGLSGYTLATEAGTIVESDVTGTASSLVSDEENAETITMSDENSQVKITEAGTYIVTGSCSDGNIVVKKGTTGVVLILQDLDLTSTTGATLSCNKTSQVQIIVQGTVTLTDAEDPTDEDSEDEDVADAYDGAALKVKDGADVYLCGDGTLNINGNAKNGIKIGDADYPSFVMDGDLTTNITAANDGINGGYDVTILGGTINVSASDDAIHADRILTIGADGTGPDINVTSSYEAFEGTVVNLFGGEATINASDDAVNAANSDGTYADLGYSINITDGTYNITCTGDGLDSNGNINIMGGTVNINSGSTNGEAGIDYDGSLYISDSASVNNNSGVSGPDGQMGQTQQSIPNDQMNQGTQQSMPNDQMNQGTQQVTPNQTDQGTQQSNTSNTSSNTTNNSTTNNSGFSSMYRMYNPNSGEHFYTSSDSEKNSLMNAGWNYEGVAWNAPTSGNPVYRLYNPNSGDHHYTTSASEKNNLVSVGWSYEGIGWYSSGSTPLYRLYNPNASAGSHHYTTSESEKNTLVKAGWTYEGIGWYGE